MKPALTACALLCVLSSTAQANPVTYQEAPLAPYPSEIPAAGLHFTLQGGLQFGGTELSRVVSEDYYGNTYSDRVRAGGLINIGAGATLQFYNSPVSLSATVNWAADTASDKDVDVSLTRTPLEFMVHYQQGLQRWGLGVTNHTSIEYRADDDSKNIHGRVDYKDAVGPMAEWSYKLTPSLWFATRYTFLQYEAERYNGAAINDAEKVNASHVSLMLRGIF